MDGSSPFRVEDDQGNRPNNPPSMEGGQASHAPPMSEPEPIVGGAIDIHKQITLPLQRVVQPAAIAP